MKKEYAETIQDSQSVIQKSETSSNLIEVIDKSHMGRPKVYQGEYKTISGRLKKENYEHARMVGGRFGGMNAYINWLIELDNKYGWSRQ